MSGWAAAGLVGGSIIQDVQARSARQHTFDFQKEFGQNQLSWRVKDAEKMGIHPLAALNATQAQGSPVYSQPAPYAEALGKAGQHLDNKRLSKLQADLLSEKVETQRLTNKSMRNAGQGDTSPYDVSGQPDGNYNNKGVEGVERPIPKAQRYTQDREGNFLLIPSQSVEQAFSEEGTITNRFLYEMRDVNFPNKVRKLRKNWSSPKYKEFKWRFLQTQPKAQDPNMVVLWNGINWQSFRKTKENAGHIFLNQKVYNPRRMKRKPSYQYHDVPMS